MSQINRVLVVEDDADGQALVSHVLEYLNITSDVVGDAETASDMLFKSRSTYDAVILDLALPGKDGWELLSEIKSNPATKSLRCIAVTAFHTSKLREEALNAGFAAYFSKPIDIASFTRALETNFAG